MKSLVIYASTSGNTRTLAEHIGAALRERGEVELLSANEAPTPLPHADLVLIGGPTEAHGMSKPTSRFFERVDLSPVRGVPAAAFDTRLRMPRIVSGSAAVGIAKRLRSAGALLLVEPESFLVTTEPKIEPAELERAGTWVGEVLAAYEAQQPVGAAG